MWMIVLYWLVGFILSVLLVLPFIVIHNVKSFAKSAASDIRGS